MIFGGIFIKLLILSGNTGGGHNSAANAVKDIFENNGIYCDIRDSLAFWGELQSDIISGGHVFIYKNTPKLFGVGYRFAENHPAKDKSTSLMYKTFSKGAKKLYELMLEQKYSAIVCTHVFSGMLATEVKRKYIPNLKIYFIATDYTCAPGTPELDASMYFIPHKFLQDEFTALNLDKDKLVPSGIPVRSHFYKKVDSDVAKEELGLPKNKRIALLMCGSMGCGPIKELAIRITTLMPEDAHLAVICGSNKSLQKELDESLDESKATVIGFTDRMDLYMDAATVAITKPGGLSSTEALVKNLPLVLIDAVPGCETRNMEFLTLNEFAETGNTTAELTSKVLSYLTSQDKCENKKVRLKKEFGENAAEVIFNRIVGDIK